MHYPACLRAACLSGPLPHGHHTGRPRTPTLPWRCCRHGLQRALLPRRHSLSIVGDAHVIDRYHFSNNRTHSASASAHTCAAGYVEGDHTNAGGAKFVEFAHHSFYGTDVPVTTSVPLSNCEVCCAVYAACVARATTHHMLHAACQGSTGACRGGARCLLRLIFLSRVERARQCSVRKACCCPSG